MWVLAFVCLAGLGSAISEPQRRQGYDYLPPKIPFGPGNTCEDVSSIVYATSTRRSVIPTTIGRVNTQYRTITDYRERVVPTTLYQTQLQTRVQLQTSVVQQNSQIVSNVVVTQRQEGRPVVQTRYVTSTRIVPQVSYITRQQVRTEVVPVYSTNIRYQTRYQDQVRVQTLAVTSTTRVRVPGRDVLSTVYRTETQVSLVRREQPGRTNYVTSTQVRNVVETRTIPSPPVLSTRVVSSQRVIPTTVFRTQYETRYVTRTQVVTQTRFRTQTQVQTQYVPEEVVVTRDVPREVTRTEYRTRVVPTTAYRTEYSTRVVTGNPQVSTREVYQTSVRRIPGQDRVVTREVVRTQLRQQVVYETDTVPRQVTVTSTVNIPCEKKGYNYAEPAVKFNF